MIITGGSYVERCRYPDWNRLFGSGLRAAVAVSAISPGSELHTYAPAAYKPDILATLSGVDVKPFLNTSGWEGQFEWLHPLHLSFWERPHRLEATIQASGDVILRFGMIEGDACVKGSRVIYDPQTEARDFSANSSTAEDLALIVTPEELVRMVHPDEQRFEKQFVQSAIVDLFNAQKVSTNLRSFVLLLKDGLGGVSVYLGDDPIRIPTYASESYFRIGAGDILATAFSYAWGEQKQDAVPAAEFAARCLAYFIDGPRLPLPDFHALPTRRFTGQYPDKVRILGYSNLEIGTLLLHTEAWIQKLNCKPILELFEPDTRPDRSVPALVLVGSTCDRASLEVLAERAGGSEQCVVFWPGVTREFSMRYFPRARVTSDYASALFHVLRGSVE